MWTRRRAEITSSPGPSTSTSSSTSPSTSVSATAAANRERVSGSARTHRPHSRQHHHHHQHRYRFNHLEAGMPVNIWGIDRRDVWRTCFCFHVRTVTIFIGVCHLMLYILYLSFLAAIFMYDAGNDVGMGKSIRQEQMLPTPVSVSNNNMKYNNDIYEQTPKSDSLTIDQSDNPRARLDPLNMVMDTRKANSQIVLLTVCNMLITLLMVYGAVRGKPSYLMPFFVLRVFDFCIFCLTMVGYFSYLPNVTDSISHSHWIPNRDALLEMDPQLLSLLALVTIVIFIAVKAYIIGVVWNCYKYLMLRNSVIRTVIAYRHDDPTNLMGMQQNLLPDLPDYDTAVNDPRYAKKPPVDPNAPSTTSSNLNNNVSGNHILGASTIAIPPPPYSVAIASEPLTFDFQVPSTEQTQQSASPHHESTEAEPSTTVTPISHESADVPFVASEVVHQSTPITSQEVHATNIQVIEVSSVAPQV